MSEMVVSPNLMKQALAGGRFLVGTMVAEFRQPAVMMLLKEAGFDFVIIDNEHGPFTIETIADLSRTARLLGLTPLVRVPDLAYPYLAQSLDAGAQGLMVPRLQHLEQVHTVVEMMKYPPLGRRGCALSRAHTNFRSGPLAETMAAVNEETLLIIQIETQEAVEQIEAIAAVPGVDVALVGPTDLSIALGVPGQLDSPVLHAAIERVIATCERHSVYPAIHINSPDWAAYWAKKGMRLVSSGAELSFLLSGAQMVAQGIKQAVGVG